MIEIAYGVVRIEDHWMIISHGLRMGPYSSRAEAEDVARRMADQASGLEVKLHLQDESGELHQERRGG